MKFLDVGNTISDCVCYRDQYYTMYPGSVCYRTCVCLNVSVCFLTEGFFVSRENRGSGLDLSDMFWAMLHDLCLTQMFLCVISLNVSLFQQKIGILAWICQTCSRLPGYLT